MDTIPFSKIADSPVFPDAYALVAQSVADDGTLLFLFVERAAQGAVFAMANLPGGGFPRSKMKVPSHFRLVAVRGERRIVTDLPALDLTFPHVDLFPDGKVLLVAARSQWRATEDYDLNGVIYDPATGSTRRILLGDGIERVYVDERGLIWASYFDEGIFGNFGWGNPGPEPVGSTGLACFTPNGERVWHFPGAMTDCYALNVQGAEVAAYYYTDFPMCKVSRDFEVTYWKTDLRGCRELALAGSTVFLSGQYEDPRNIGYLGSLGADRLEDVRQVRLMLPEDVEWSASSTLLGRGRHVYCFDTSGTYRATLG
jgi:hypothetical protein